MRGILLRSIGALAALLSISGVEAATLFANVAGSQLWRVDTTAVTATLVSSFSTGISSEIEWDGAGTIYWSDTDVNTNLHRTDTGGILTSTGTMSFPAGGNVITAMEFVGSTLYGGFTTEGGGSSSLTTINTATDVVTLIGGTGITSPIGGLAYDGLTMYTINVQGSISSLYSVNLGTGAASLIGSTGVALTGLEFGSDGVLYTLGNAAGSNGDNLYSINPLTGASTLLGNLGVGVINCGQFGGAGCSLNGLTTAAVPIPAAFWLFGSALGLLGWMRRKAT
jgi:hypothetical protein